MNLVLERYGFGKRSTLGELSIDGEFLCYTIEDARRKAKKPGETCIPVGTYALRLRTEGGLHAKYAKRFPASHMGMLWLQDVPGFDFVYLHAGNTSKDSEGCPLLNTVAFVGEGEFHGGLSEKAYTMVYERIIGRWHEGPVSVTVREREPLA